MGDYFILCYFCPITNIQCVGRKSSWRLRGRPKVLHLHNYHLDTKISVAHANYTHANFSLTLIGLFNVVFIPHMNNNEFYIIDALTTTVRILNV